MYRSFVFIFMLGVFITSPAQTVGLALSGGGARGLAHIGLIKALEDNEIPIDYIVGTSMGAIVGSLYAMGYSTDEMIEIFRSEDFKDWSEGTWPNEYNYFYKKREPEPDFFRINFEADDSFKISPKLPVNLVSSGPLSFGFLRLYGKANAIANENFDSLMVPFRCVATNIEHNTARVFNKGDLGKCVRASMAFPFYYKPVTIDDTLYFDGGIVQNYPVDILKKEFHPDFIIGHNVNKKLQSPSEDDLLTQIQNMIMIRSEVSLDEKDGILLETLFDNNLLFDFEKIDFFVDSAYHTAMREMDAIKAKVNTRKPLAEVEIQRETFKSKLPPLVFRNFQFEGLNAQQLLYVSRALNKADSLSIDEYEKIYYKLLSSDHIKEITPVATYNPQKRNYDLYMGFDLNNNTTLKIGGNFSTGPANQGFLGVERRFLNSSASTLKANFHFGQVYNAGKLSARFDIERNTPLSVKLELIRHSWNYYETNLKYFFEGNESAYLRDVENRFSLSMATPITFNSKFTATADAAYQNQEYLYQSTTSISDGTTTSGFLMFAPKVEYEYNTLNDKQFPTEGLQVIGSAKYIYGNETYSSTSSINNINQYHHYPLVKGKVDSYFKWSKVFHLGVELEYAFSAMDTMNSYTITNLYSPAYLPTPLSKTQMLQPFRAPHYFAGGLKPVFILNNNIHFRLGAYAMMPIKAFKGDDESGIDISYSVKELNYMAFAGLVFQYPFGTISVTADYFHNPASNYFVNLNFGYLLFNRRATD